MGGRLSKSEQRMCENPSCAKLFHTYYNDKRFCTNKCRIEKWNLDNPRVKKEKINVTTR